MLPFLIAGACGIAAGEVLITVRRREKRRQMWSRAQRCAEATLKPLLVLGDPDVSIHRHGGRDYGCGAGVLDPADGGKCPGGAPTRFGIDGPPRPLCATAESMLPRLPPDSAVIFVSCVLEYVDDLPLVWHHLHRVSGGDLFVVTIEPHALVLTGLSPVYPHKAKWKIKKINGTILTAVKT